MTAKANEARVPPAASRASEKPRGAAWADWTSSGHILVVDDEEAIRNVIQRALITIGFTVRIAPSGKEALSLFARESAKFVLVVLDLRMPGMDPGEIVRALRAMRPDIKILLVSGYDRQKALRHLQEHQLTGFLPKPFNLAELTAKVKSLLGD